MFPFKKTDYKRVNLASSTSNSSGLSINISQIIGCHHSAGNKYFQYSKKFTFSNVLVEDFLSQEFQFLSGCTNGLCEIKGVGFELHKYFMDGKQEFSKDQAFTLAELIQRIRYLEIFLGISFILICILMLTIKVI